jgi:hypothetical protein
MRTIPALSGAAIRAFSRHLAEQLANTDLAALQAQPGRVFFPKRIHELGIGEGETPDGLSMNYLTLAAQLNRQAQSRKSGSDLLALLLRAVEMEITRARLAEGRLLQALDRFG